MELTENQGLTIATVDAAEVAGRPWLAAGRHVDVVRVDELAGADRAALAAAGFLHKPSWLSWKAELGPDEDAYLSRLAAKARGDIRRARDRAERSLRIATHDRITAGTLDRFLALYEERVAEMTYGVAVATRYRERVLDGPDKYFAVLATDGDELAGGCLVLECQEQDMVRIRFSAVTPEWRRASLSRTLYFAAMRTARDKGYKWVSLGDEPNLYGHVAKAGLFRFKVAMGFSCVPSQDNHDPHGRDIADLVLNFDNLCDPCLVLAYPPHGPDRDLTAHVYSATEPDPRHYAAPFLAGVEPHPVAA
jgi:GNAT superfamily N-acetyltransferase